MRLKKALQINQDVNLKQAHNLWRDGDFYRSKKRVFTVIQMIIFSRQVAEKGYVYNIFEANVYHHQIVNYDENLNGNQMWSDFQKSWENFKNLEMEKIHLIFDSRKVWEIDNCQEECCDNAKKFIKTFGPSELVRSLSIRTQVHPLYENLFYLMSEHKYTPWGSIVGRQCDGLILDYKNDFEIVCFPGNRIFVNDSEPLSVIDWNNSSVYDWMDGHMLTLFFHAGVWNLSSLHSPDASTLFVIDGTEKTESEIFWQIFSEKNYELPTNTDQCYTWELLHKDLRNYVLHTESDLILARVFDKSLGRELHISEFSHRSWKVRQVVGRKQKVLELEDLLKNESKFGFVVQDDHNFTSVIVMSKLMKNLYKIEKMHDEDLPMVEHLLVQTLAEFYFHPIIQNYPQNHSYHTFLDVKSKFDLLAMHVDDCSKKLENITNFKELVEVFFPSPMRKFTMTQKETK
eukprot:TRINITY_DN7324_c0_g1_i1.p1 TRINITY_DN7324_c0_g1~~TRINITY_DN7324_c0_g1_i1.p1  ORF type:complete len:458 (-),score=86.97 TRINITY_DN7324_c0_g1_i1:416-1789(-)